MAFRRHFRIYFKNNHPAYIVDEEGNMYVFHRTTHSKKSGKRNNWEKENPINDGDKRKMYIVKKEQKDNKGRFSLFELEIKPDVDIDNLLIKKAGGSQPIGTNNVTTSIDDGKSKTLTHKSHSSSKSIKPKRKKERQEKWKIVIHLLARYVAILIYIQLDI